MPSENTAEYVKFILRAKLKNFKEDKSKYSIEDRKMLCLDIFEFCVKNFDTIKRTLPKSFHKIISDRLRKFREEDDFLEDEKYDILLTWC